MDFAFLIAAFAIGPLHAQPTPTPAYTYDVVSTHKSDPAERNSGFSPGPQGGLHARNETTMQLLAFAFGVREYQLVGVPGWAKSGRFDVQLTPDRSEAPLPDNPNQSELDGWLTRNRQRMQAVLRDRFGLVIRRERREMPLYALTVSKGGHNLSAAANPGRGVSLNINGGQQIVGREDVGGLTRHTYGALRSRRDWARRVLRFQRGIFAGFNRYRSCPEFRGCAARQQLTLDLHRSDAATRPQVGAPKGARADSRGRKAGSPGRELTSTFQFSRREHGSTTECSPGTCM